MRIMYSIVCLAWEAAHFAWYDRMKVNLACGGECDATGFFPTKARSLP